MVPTTAVLSEPLRDRCLQHPVLFWRLFPLSHEIDSITCSLPHIRETICLCTLRSVCTMGALAPIVDDEHTDLCILSAFDGLYEASETRLVTRIHLPSAFLFHGLVERATKLLTSFLLFSYLSNPSHQIKLFGRSTAFTAKNCILSLGLLCNVILIFHLFPGGLRLGSRTCGHRSIERKLLVTPLTCTRNRD